MSAMTRMESTGRTEDNSINDTYYIESSRENTTHETLYEIYHVYIEGNEMYDSENQYVEYQKNIRIIIPIMFGLITVIGLIGNTLTIAVVLYNKIIKDVTNVLIMNLAVADLLFVVFCIPFTAANMVMNMWPFGDVWCRIVQYLMYVFAYASMYILVLISIDRYLALVHPMKALSLRTKRKCYIALTVIWSVILLVNIPLILEHSEIYFTVLGQERSVCSIVNNLDYNVLRICFFLFGYLLPLTLICVLYGFVLKVAFTRNILGENTTRSVPLQSRKRVTKMVVIVLMVFAICWLPLHIVQLYVVFVDYRQNYVLLSYLNNAAMCMAFFNSCINPIIYTFYSKTFRKGFRDLVSCKTRNSETDNAVA